MSSAAAAGGFRRGAAPRAEEEADAPLGEGSMVDVALRLPVSVVRALLSSELAALAEERAAHGALSPSRCRSRRAHPRWLTRPLLAFPARSR
jgi:hypothetical protein